MSNNETISAPVKNVEHYKTAVVESAAMPAYKAIKLMIIDNYDNNRLNGQVKIKLKFSFYASSKYCRFPEVVTSNTPMVYATVTAIYDNETNCFAVNINDIAYKHDFYTIEETELANGAKQALEYMLNPELATEAAKMYNVQLIWGDAELLYKDGSDYLTKGFVAFENMTQLFENAPRFARNSFTLHDDGNYCFIIFVEDCKNEVKIKYKTISENGEENIEETQLDNTKSYIVSPTATLTVDGNEEPLTLSPGNIYYICPQTEDNEE